MDENLRGARNEKTEGILDAEDALDISLEDDEIRRIIGTRIEDSEAYWNSEMKLSEMQKRNETYWNNTAFDENQLYDFQVAYKDNRIFLAIEQLVANILSNPIQPVVSEAQDTDASRELAENLETVLLAQYEDLYLKSRFSMVARHLLAGMRFAVMKYRWDNEKGRLLPDGTRKGGLDVQTLRPQRVVIDKGASDPEDIPLLGEYQSSSVEELMFRFPKKKDEIWKRIGKKGSSTNQSLASKVGYVETWFSYYGGNGEKKEGVCWKMDDIVLDKMKNPNWNYDETKIGDDGKPIYNNFLERPQKPYVIFNYMNLGRFVIDDTSLVEQAIPLQDILNKRGRQIVENADQASSGTIFNTDMVSAETMAQLTGNPAEKVGVKGDVRQAAMRLPTSVLEPYVLEDKKDARDEIDNIFGTRDPIRDEDSNVKTVGQTVISQRQDLGRLKTLAGAIEDGADRLYKGLVQMMKVFYDEEQMIKYIGTEGATTFVEFSRDKIEDGVAVRVKSGSVLPDDPASKQNIGIQTAPLIDPLSFAELMAGKDPFKDPEEMANRMFLFKAAPDKYYQEILGQNPEGQTDPQAQTAINQLNQGGQPVPPESPSKNYIAQHQAFIQSPQFQQLPPEAQQAHIQHAKQTSANAQKALGMQQQGEPAGKTGQPTSIVQQLLQRITGS